MLATLARQVGQEWGQADGVIVFDPSAFPKNGSKEDLESLASSPRVGAHGRVVPEPGDAAGKKLDPGPDVAATPPVDWRSDRCVSSDERS